MNTSWKNTHTIILLAHLVLYYLMEDWMVLVCNVLCNFPIVSCRWKSFSDLNMIDMWCGCFFISCYYGYARLKFQTRAKEKIVATLSNFAIEWLNFRSTSDWRLCMGLIARASSIVGFLRMCVCVCGCEEFLFESLFDCVAIWLPVAVVQLLAHRWFVIMMMIAFSMECERNVWWMNNNR